MLKPAFSVISANLFIKKKQTIIKDKNKFFNLYGFQNKSLNRKWVDDVFFLNQ